MTIFGRRDRFAIELEPLSGAPSDPDPAAAATWCALRIWADGKNLTAHTRKRTSSASDALHWPAIYLARWFVRAWPGLWERAGWPLPGALVDAELACRRLDRHLAELGPDADDDLLERRDGFVASHALLAAASGGLMPGVYLMREGPHMHVAWKAPGLDASDVVFHEPQGRVQVSGDEFLEAVATFLWWCKETVAGCDAEFAREIDEWQSRITRPEAAEAVLRGYIRPWGVAASRVALLATDPDLMLPAGWQSAGARLDPSRFSAAVVFRALAPAVDADDVLALLARLRSYPSLPESSDRLEALRSGLVVSAHEPPHLQGYGLAERLRLAIGNPDAHFDVEVLLAELGIQLDNVDMSDVSVDAATVWGDDHGPVILVNSLGVRNQSWARRMTLAHELCHLLVDRHAAAELMVASTPWAPPELERRANAFAAELLLPKAGIMRVAGDAVRLGWVDQALRTALMDEFQVGATVCDHQIENRLRIGG